MAAAVKLRRVSYSSRLSLQRLLTTLARNNSLNCVRRHFLSAAFRCDGAWAERLSEPAIKNIKPVAHFKELDRKFGARVEKGDLHGVWAIDVDLFANADIDHDNLADLEEVVQRFRRTPATINMLPSTTHAVVRHFLHFGQHRVLMRMLEKPAEHGIFPDDYCCSLVMDTFLKQKNFRDATKVAMHMMLQEELGSPIAKHLSLYSCLSYLRNPQPEPWDTEPPPPPPGESSEQIIIRLSYLPPVYFDDHFDLKDPSKLIGKTLSFLGKSFDGELGRTCVLIGYALHEKWDKVEAFCAQALQEKKLPFFKEGVTRVRQVIESIADDEMETRLALTNKILPLLDQLEGTTIDGDMVDVAKKLTETAVKQHEAADIDEQIGLYRRWAEVRLEEIQHQVDAVSREKRMEEIREIKEGLKKREQLLFFFENFELHAMNVDKYDAVAAEVQLLKAKKKTKDEDESYVPPDVRHKPNKRA